MLKFCTHGFFTLLKTIFCRIFESGSSDLNNSKVRDSWDLKNKPDGWETTSKGEEDGNIWEMSQREEDILVQEYERRIAFSKFQVSFLFFSTICYSYHHMSMIVVGES